MPARLDLSFYAKRCDPLLANSMRRHPRLNVVANRATRRLDRLLALSATLHFPSTAIDDRLAAFLSIEALNCWNTFLREYYVAATVVGAKDGNGGRVVSHIFPNEQAAILEAIRHVNRSRFVKLQQNNSSPTWWDEPRWATPNIFMNILRGVGFNNLQSVGIAFTVTSDVFISFPVVRNFFAHRTEGTAAKLAPIAQRHGLPQKTHASSIMSFIPQGGAANLAEQWLSDLRSIAGQLA